MIPPANGAVSPQFVQLVNNVPVLLVDRWSTEQRGRAMDVNTAVDNLDAMIASHVSGLLDKI